MNKHWQDKTESSCDKKLVDPLLGDWRRQLQYSFAGPEGLRVIKGYDLSSKELDVLQRYPFRVTSYYAEIGKKALVSGSQGINLQFMPQELELKEFEGFVDDPFAELYAPIPGLVHRFKDRLLILATNRCAVNCRHCTRKNSISSLQTCSTRDDFQPIVDYAKSHSEIREVIISGGDPLMLESEDLDWLLGSLGLIGHIEVFRIGTRVPVVLPMRIDDELTSLLRSHRPLWVNTQFNHYLEITDLSIGACDRLLTCGIPVSNQAVLLKGINDDHQTVIKLCNELQRNMIRPYYIFSTDPVRGTGHFAVSIERARLIAGRVRSSVGGLSFPRFVRDVPGVDYKTDIDLFP